MGTSILLVAGEASADLHGSALVRELKKTRPDVSFFGVGGRHLADEGMEIVVEAASINIVGLTGWWHKLARVYQAYRYLCRLAKERKPACAVLLDLPDFNLFLAGTLKRLGIPVVYYISPQVWAWRKYRIHKIRHRVSKMLVLFPFEKDFYLSHGVDAAFVGHPLLDRLKPRKIYREQEKVREAPRIALLPGSRGTEIRYIAPLLAEVTKKLREEFPKAEFRVPVASTLDPSFVEEHLSQPGVFFERGNAYDILEWADFALVASGTATLETAILGTPFALIYRVSASNAFAFHYLFRYRGHIGMPNLLMKREIIKEFFQEEATTENLLAESRRLILDEGYRKRMIEDLVACRRTLGSDVGASERAAAHVASVIQASNIVGGPRLAPVPSAT